MEKGQTSVQEDEKNSKYLDCCFYRYENEDQWYGSDMKHNNHENSQIIKIGPDSLEELPDLIRGCAHKALLVHGHRPVEDGLLTKVRILLNKEQVPYANMGQILPNPTYKSVKRGIKIARKENCDVIIALGGGSTLQCAKGIALGLHYKGDVWDFWTGKKKPKKTCPIASVMTNPSSGAELSTSCTLVKKGERKTIHDPSLKCTFAILDPKLSMYPLFPTMNQAFGLFIHLFFAALKTDDEKQLEEAITLIKDLFLAADQLKMNQDDLEARTSLFKIGYQSHTKLNVSKCSIESIASNLSFKYSLTEGTAGSMLFIAWLKSLNQKQKERSIEIAKEVFSADINQFEQALSLFKKQLQSVGLPLSIPESGLIISDEELKKHAVDQQTKEILLNSNKP